MKLIYADESGIGGEPFAVMAGIVVDTQRMHKTKAEWLTLLSELSAKTGRPVAEFHTKDFYPGNGIWRGMQGPERAEVMDLIGKWITERKHDIVVVACDAAEYFKHRDAGSLPAEVASLWRFLATHFLLALQREHQTHDKNKGHSLIIFDEENTEKEAIAQFVLSPPSWTDTYYGRKKKDVALNQIVDVPYFVDSKHAALVQTADYLAFVFRKYLELKSGRVAERFDGEFAKIESWAQTLAERSITPASVYPEKGRCACAEMYFSRSPEQLRALLRAG